MNGCFGWRGEGVGDLVTDLVVTLCGDCVVLVQFARLLGIELGGQLLMWVVFWTNEWFALVRWGGGGGGGGGWRER